MFQKWYIDPNEDGTADVYRGDTTTALRTSVQRQGEESWQEVCGKMMESEVSREES
jgi:hypothetical protein